MKSSKVIKKVFETVVALSLVFIGIPFFLVLFFKTIQIFSNWMCLYQ